MQNGRLLCAAYHEYLFRLHIQPVDGKGIINQEIFHLYVNLTLVKSLHLCSMMKQLCDSSAFTILKSNFQNHQINMTREGTEAQQVLMH